MEILKTDKTEIIQNKIKIWYSTHTMDGKVTVAYSEGQDLIAKGDDEKIAMYKVKEIADELWNSKKVAKKDKK